MSTTDLAARMRQHVAQARAIKDAFEGKQMPAEAAHQMEQHLEAAEGLKARQTLRERGETTSLDGSLGLDDLDHPGSGPAPDRKVDRLAPETKLVDHLNLARYSDEVCYGALGVLVKAQVVPVDGNEVAAWMRRVGQSKDMLTSGSGGNLVPVPIAARVIDLMRANTVVAKLGARTVPMTSATLKVPRATGDVTASWLSEGATITASDATLDAVTLTAQRLEAMTKVSMELSEDSDPVGIGEVVATSIASAMALKVDAAALRGTGTAPEPRGIRNQSGVNLIALGTNGGAATWSTLVNMQSVLGQSNAAGTGFVLHPRTMWALADSKDTTNQFIAPPASLADVWAASAATTALPTNIVKGTSTNCTEVYAGDWVQLMLGLRIGFSLQTLVELYRAEGKIGLVGRMRADVGLDHGQAFAVVTDVTN